MTLPNIPSFNRRRRISESADLAATSLLEMSQSTFTYDTAMPEPYYDTYYPAMEGSRLREDAEVEENFCSDFVCCGLCLPDLHALLQHYEESHVKMEELGEPCMAYTPYGYGRPESNQYYGVPGHGGMRSGGVGGMNGGGRNRIVSMDIEPQDVSSERPSAFDTTVFRTLSPIPYYHHNPYNSSYHHSSVRRPKPGHGSLASDPNAINKLRSMLPTVLSNEAPDNSLRLIHSALSSTINPPKHSSSGKKGTRLEMEGCSDDEGGSQGAHERPYVCPVSGCGKTYKNANGLKYHTIHGHHREGQDGHGNESIEKPHTCPFPHCLKRYKNPNGLKYHMLHGHPGQTHPGRQTIASMKSIAGLNQIEAAVKREQAIRAQLAAQNAARNQRRPE